MQPFLMKEGHSLRLRRSFQKKRGKYGAGEIFRKDFRSGGGLWEGIVPVFPDLHGIIKVVMFFQESQKGASHVK